MISFQSAGYLIAYSLWIKKHRHEMKTHILKDLSDDQLTVVKVPLHEDGRNGIRLEFEHDDEFKMNGEMYDIVRTEIQNDSVVYYTIHDIKESALVQWLNSTINERTKQDPSTQQHSQFLLSIGQLQYETGGAPLFTQHFNRHSYQCEGCASASDHPHLTDIPPPKGILS